MGLIIGVGRNKGGALVKPIIVDALPAASEGTMNQIYLVPSASDTDMFDVYYTIESGGSYSWEQDGSVSREGFEIADNLTTNDATKALSAHQGKVLDEKVTALGHKVDDIQTDLYPFTRPVPAGFILNTSLNQFRSGTNRQCYFIAVSGGENYIIKANPDYNTTIAFLNSVPTSDYDAADYVTGTSSIAIGKGTTSTGTIPAGTSYLYVSKLNGAANQCPVSVKLDGVEYIKSTGQQLIDLTKEVDDLEVDVDATNASVDAIMQSQTFNIVSSATRKDYYGTFLAGSKVTIESAAGNPGVIVFYIYKPDNTYYPGIDVYPGETKIVYLPGDSPHLRLYPASTPFSADMTIAGPLPATINRVDELEVSGTGFYKGKKLVSIGDSYSKPGKWQTKLAQIKGFDFDQAANEDRYSVSGTPTLSAASNCGQQRAKLVVQDGTITPDVIIVENVNDRVDNIGTSADEPYFVGTRKNLSITPLATKESAAQYFADNISTILSGETQGHGFCVGIPYDGYGNASVMTFNSAPSQDGRLRIKYGTTSYRYINVESTDTIADVIDKIMEFAWTHLNLTSTSNTITFSPDISGSTRDVSIVENTTGMNISVANNQPSILYLVETYPLHDMTDWLVAGGWVDLATITLWSAYKGLFNYLSLNFPQAEIYWMSPIAYDVDVTDAAFQFADGTIDTDKVLAGIQFTTLSAAQKDICEYCKIPFLDLEKYAGIYPENVATYFPANNYHPNNAGYDRWGIAVASFLL